MSDDYIGDKFCSLEHIKEDFYFGCTPKKVLAIDYRQEGFSCCTVIYDDHDDIEMMEIRVLHKRSGVTYTSRHATSFHNKECFDNVPFMFYYAMCSCIVKTERYVGAQVKDSLRKLLDIGGINL